MFKYSGKQSVFIAEIDGQEVECKKCNTCEKVKALHEFHSNGANRGKYSRRGSCGPCENREKMEFKGGKTGAHCSQYNKIIKKYRKSRVLWKFDRGRPYICSEEKEPSFFSGSDFFYHLKGRFFSLPNFPKYINHL